MNTSVSYFTAAQIARALGFSRQAARKALADVPADGREIRGGIEVPVWQVASLPLALRERLAEQANKRGYRDMAHLLSDPPKRWQPPIPISEVAPHHIEKATRTRAALRRGIIAALDPFSPRGESLRLAVEHYRREFGKVSQAHVYRLIERTLDRDGGEGRFEDIALYLDDKLSRIPSDNPPIARCGEERMILDRVDSISNPQSPTRAQLELLWATICEAIDLMIGRGVPAKRARRSVVTLLGSIAIRLAKSDAALRDLVKAKHERWVAGGRCLAAIADQRPHKSGWHRAPKLDDETINRIVGHALINCGGRESQAWREIVNAGELPPELAATYTSTPSRKSYVPNRIRRIVTPEVDRLQAIHRGPREAKLSGAHHTRRYDDAFAGDWYSSDDCTCPVYFYMRDQAGEVVLTRGQFLPCVDVVSAKVLSFVLIPHKQYDSLSIRELITRASLEHGLPGKGLVFENGIWRRAKILTGRKDALPWEEADRGLRGLGLQIIHAKLPRGKQVENILGILQNKMERLPGYVGRDEVHDKFERVQRQKLDVLSGRESPEKFFFSLDQITDVYARLIAEYNDEPQEGRLGGRSPNEAWDERQNPVPRPRFDHRTSWVLAHDVRKVKVGRNGITIRMGKRTFNYKSEATGRFTGQHVVARFNPAASDVLPFQAEGSDEIFFAELAPETPAFGGGEIFERNERLIEAHNSYARNRYHVVANSLPEKCFRANLVDYQTEAIGRAIEAQREIVKEKRVRTQRASRAAREVGMRIHPDSRIDDRRINAAERLKTLISDEP